MSTANRVHLVLLDTSSGEMIKEFDNPDNKLYVQPHFSRDGNSIIMVLSGEGSKAIVKVDIESERETTLLKPVAENISAPLDFDKYILYNSTRSGIDNIYAVDTATKRIYRVTDRKFGAFNACISPDNTTIAFQDFTPDGFRIAIMPLKPGEWKDVAGEKDTATEREYFQPYAKEEAGNILSHIPDSVYPLSPYRRLRNSVKIYSWGIDPLTNLPHMGVGIRSQDMLSTTELEAGFRYDKNEESWGKYFKVNYNGLYPQFFFAYADGKRRSIFSNGEADTAGIKYDMIGYRDINIGAGLPLNFSGGSFIRKINLTAQSIHTELSQLYFRNASGKKFSRLELGDFYSFQYDASFEMRSLPNLRDVAPKFGAILQITVRNTPFKSFFQAKQTAVNAGVYLPGFFKHHSIRLRYYWQEDANSNYHFENRFDFIRNKKDQLFHGLRIWSVDYKMPLCYPDLQVLKGVLYFQRLKADLFTEICSGKPSFESLNNPINHYTNIGIEFTADVNIMRFLIPFEAGIRSSYLIQDHSISNQVIFKIPLF